MREVQWARSKAEDAGASMGGADLGCGGCERSDARFGA